MKVHKIDIQSMVNATNSENIDRFLADLRLVLIGVHAAMTAAGRESVEVEEMSWIDDGINAGTVAVNETTHIELIKNSDNDNLEKQYGKVVDNILEQFSDMTFLHKQRHFLLMACHYLAANNIYVAVGDLHAFIILCEQWLYMEDLIVSATYFAECYLSCHDSFRLPLEIYEAKYTDLYHDACAKTSVFDGASFEDIFNNSSCVRLECRTNQGYHYYYAMSFEDWKQLKQK
jgi:hypothetical protein